jgi:hypothetical protein
MAIFATFCHLVHYWSLFNTTGNFYLFITFDQFGHYWTLLALFITTGRLVILDIYVILVLVSLKLGKV